MQHEKVAGCASQAKVGPHAEGPRPVARVTNGTLAPLRGAEYNETVGRQTAIVLYVLALIAIVVGVDVLFFRHQFAARLMVNVGIVLVFWACYLRFVKRP
jgi:hypothetical protein